MTWKLNDAGHHESETHVIEHEPKRNEHKPYYLYKKEHKPFWLNFKGCHETLDIAKRAAR